ncbi:nuclease-related domain-containing protein [Humibacter ginsengisoli]
MARLFGRSPVSVATRSWYVGALGELTVADHLRSLGPEWAVLHSLPVGTRGSDIDHLLIGPGGVFTLNTKYHEGASIWVGGRRILVNGRGTDHLRNSRYESDRVARLLSAGLRRRTSVTPVLVFVHPKRITIRERPAGVEICRASHLVAWLRHLPHVNTRQEVIEIASVARTPSTWGPQPAQDPSVPPMFAALQREVRKARRIRTAWVLVVVAGVMTIGPAMIALHLIDATH